MNIEFYTKHFHLTDEVPFLLFQENNKSVNKIFQRFWSQSQVTELKKFDRDARPLLTMRVDFIWRMDPKNSITFSHSDFGITFLVQLCPQR